MKARELGRILRAMGAEERAVPNHKGEDIRKGTLAAIEASMEPCLGRNWLRKIIGEGRWRAP